MAAYGDSGGAAPPRSAAQRPRPHPHPHGGLQAASLRRAGRNNSETFTKPNPFPPPRAPPARQNWTVTAGAALRGSARSGPRPAPPVLLSEIALRSSETRRGRAGYVLRASPPYFVVFRLKFLWSSQAISAGSLPAAEDARYLAFTYLACW